MNDRFKAIELISEATSSGCRKNEASAGLGVSIRTMERWENHTDVGDQRKGPITMPSNKLSPEERKEVLSVVNSLRFCDATPSKIVPALADEGEYLASESTFYRILKEENLLAHRSNSKPRQTRKPDEHIAVAPNKVWSWDISYLKTLVAGIYFYLYLVMDIYSRKIVGWEVHERESSELSSELMIEAFIQEGITGEDLVIHQDNGSPMKGATLLATFQKLGVIPSYSRPSVSDDNPFSESLFKTLKYCPFFPAKPFKDLQEAREWVKQFVYWYNKQHLHSGIKFVTPEDRHNGKDLEILTKRKWVYENAKMRNPSRWSGKTRNWEMIKAVRLNPLKSDKTSDIQCAA